MRQSLLLQARNAFEVLSRLPHHGMGSKLSRTSWTDDCFWTVQKVRLSPDGKHGKAWGVLTWRGQPQQPTQIAGPLKPVWRSIQDAGAQQQQWTSELAAVLHAERQAAAQAAAAAKQPAAAETEQPAAAEAEQPSAA